MSCNCELDSEITKAQLSACQNLLVLSQSTCTSFHNLQFQTWKNKLMHWENTDKLENLMWCGNHIRVSILNICTYNEVNRESVQSFQSESVREHVVVSLQFPCFLVASSRLRELVVSLNVPAGLTASADASVAFWFYSPRSSYRWESSSAHS